MSILLPEIRIWEPLISECFAQINLPEVSIETA